MNLGSKWQRLDSNPGPCVFHTPCDPSSAWLCFWSAWHRVWQKKKSWLTHKSITILISMYSFYLCSESLLSTHCVLGTFLGAGIQPGAKLAKITALVGLPFWRRRQTKEHEAHVWIWLQGCHRFICASGSQTPWSPGLSTSHKTLRSPKSFCLFRVYLFDISYIKS